MHSCPPGQFLQAQKTQRMHYYYYYATENDGKFHFVLNWLNIEFSSKI